MMVLHHVVVPEVHSPCTTENISAMKEWLIQQYSASTINQCTHQPLPGMVDPDISLHFDVNATPYAAHTSAPIPLHWQNAIEEQLGADVAMGILENFPFGEPLS